MDSNVTTSSAQPNSGDPNISWPTERISHRNEEWHSSFHSERRESDASETSTSAPVTDLSNYPDGHKSLAGISVRAFLLGITFGLTLSLTLLFTAICPTPLWRAPFFIAALCLFHFLEFWVTARYNTRYATVSAFLLSSNGWAYNVAHGSAVAECIMTHFLWPRPWIIGRALSVTEPISGYSVSLLVVLGLSLTVAMAQAASNFNHHVQSQHKAGHVLVKSGIYRFLRHPSYFGFFWWGLGTQLVLGNVVCFVGYAVVLWRFFSTRIKRKCFPRTDLWQCLANQRPLL